MGGGSRLPCRIVEVHIVMMKLLLLLLLLPAAMESDKLTDAACLGSSNAQLPVRACQHAGCQMDEIVYCACVGANSRVVNFHILLPSEVQRNSSNGFGNLSISVKHPFSDKTFPCRYRVSSLTGDCSGFDTLLVAIESVAKEDHIFIRVESLLQVRYYGFYFMEKPCPREPPPGGWHMMLGYILEATQPHETSSSMMSSRAADASESRRHLDWIDRFVVIVNKPPIDSEQFHGSRLLVKLHGEHRDDEADGYIPANFWEATINVSSCSGSSIWCALDVKRSASASQWHSTLTASWVNLIFELPKEYEELHAGVTSPQQLAVVDLKQWYQSSPEASSAPVSDTTGLKMCPEAESSVDNDVIIVASCATANSGSSRFNLSVYASVAIAVIGCILALLLLLLAALYLRYRWLRRPHSQARVLLVISKDALRWHERLRLQWLRRRLRRRGCHVSVDRLTDAERLRAASALHDLVLILFRVDDSSKALTVPELQQLTVPESRCDVLRICGGRSGRNNGAKGSDALWKLRNRLEEFLLQRRQLNAGGDAA